MSSWPETSRTSPPADPLRVSFVDRYIPGYIFFGDTVENGYIDEREQIIPPWKGNALRILIGAKREVVGSVMF